MINKERAAFEKKVSDLFIGIIGKEDLEHTEDESGYKNQYINAIWVGYTLSMERKEND